MTRNDRVYGRRTVLEGIGTAGLGLAGVGTASAAVADPGGGSGSAARDAAGVVSEATARTVVENKVKAVASRPRLSAWADGTIGQPTTLHAKNGGAGPAYVPAAYVFPVRNGGQDLGYVTASARPDWAPVLEYSPASPPSRLVADAAATARANGATPTGRLLYHGGVKYGLELDDGRAMNVRNGRPAPVRDDFEPSSMSFRPETVERHWSALAGPGGAATAGDPSAQATWDVIWDVPAWTEHDDGGADSTLYGSGADAWDEWDGCVPVAASMVVAYHEGYTSSDAWVREWYIDELHDDMNTNDAGSTWPTDIDNGFDDFSEGDYSYDGSNIYVWTHPDFTKSEITDNSRPFLLNMSGGGTAEDRTQSYGDHTTTVVGYASEGEELELHDTWDDSYHYLAWGSWTVCSYTKVTTS